MAAVMKTIGVISIMMLFLVATTVSDEHPNIPCCDGEYTSCCKSTDDANVTTFGVVVGRKGALGQHVHFLNNHP